MKLTPHLHLLARFKNVWSYACISPSWHGEGQLYLFSVPLLYVNVNMPS